MASDVGAILAALANGAQSDSNSGKSDSGMSRVVGITLRLIADPGNATVIKELTDQVSGAAHKALQEMDELRGKVRVKTSEWAASVGHSVSSAWQHRSSDASPATGKVAAELEETHAGKKRSPAVQQGASHRAATPHSQHAQKSKASEIKATEGGRREQFEKGTDELGDVGSHLIDLAKRVAVLTSRDEKTAEARKKAFEPIENIYGVAEDSWKVAKGAGKVFKSFSPAATVQPKGAGIVRNAARGAGAAETASTVGGVAGAATASGTDVLAGAGTMAAAAGVGALIVSAGIGVHDILAKLTGKFGTISGATSDLLGSIKRSAALEEHMNAQRASQIQSLATITDYEGRIAKAAEGRARILEFQKVVGELNLQAEREQVAWRSAVRKQMRPTATNKEQSEAEKRGDARQEITETLAAFDRDIAEKERVHDLAHRRVAVAQLNQERRQKAREISFEGGDESKKLNPDAGQANPGLFGAAWRGITDLFTVDRIHATYRLSRDEDVNKANLKARGFDEPTISPSKDLLQEKLTEQQGMAKAAQDVTESIQKRGAFLQQQSELMKQQLQTSRDLVISTKEQLTLAERGVHSRLADLATKSKSEQVFIKKNLDDINAGKKITPAAALKLRGLVGGQAGDVVDQTIAETAIPGLADTLKRTGDPAFQNLTKAQRANAAANTAVKEDEETDNRIHAALAANTASAQRHGVKAITEGVAAEQSKAQKEGYPDPTAGIIRNGEGIRGDLQELGKTINTQFGLIRAEITALAQRVKSGHN